MTDKPILSPAALAGTSAPAATARVATAGARG